MLPLKVSAWVYDGIVIFCHFEIDVKQHVTCYNTNLLSVDLFFTWVYLCAQCGSWKYCPHKSIHTELDIYAIII